MPNDRGVVRGHTPTIGTNRVEGDRASLASSCPLPRHATLVLCVPGVRASSTFDSRARHPRLTSHCRCRGNTLRARLESLMTLKLVRMPGGRGLTTPRAWQACEHGPYAQQVARSVELEDDRTEAQGVVESWAGGGVSRGAPRPQPEARNGRAPSDPARSLDRVRNPPGDPLVSVAAGVEAIERQAVFEGEDVGRLHDRDERIVGESLDQLGVPVVDERIELAAEGSADERVVQPDHEHARLRTDAADDVYGLLDAAEDVIHEALRIGWGTGPEVVAPEIVSADGDDDHVRLAQQPLDARRVELLE